MKKILCILFCIQFFFWGGLMIYKAIIYDIKCGGHLKRAADANTIEIAKKELEIALNYIESKGMTKGYTSILYNTPDEDVGFWYQNLSASLSELRAVPENATQLEKSNILMKLRETLLDQKEDRPKVTEPNGISRFPYNTEYAIWGIISIIIMISGILLIWEDL